MKITLSKEETLEIIHNALCNGLGWIGGYGISVSNTKAEYEEAKKSLSEDDKSEFQKKHNMGFCYEDVLTKILKDGKALKFYDSEQEEDVQFTLEEATERLQDESVAQHVLDMMNENDDAITADCILQTAMYGEIVFG